MNFKVGKIFGVLCTVFAISAVLALNIFGETFNSNIFTAEQKDNFADFKGKSVSTTANLNWQTDNGEKITRTTVKNLPSYLLTVNASKEGRKKAIFISSPKESLDMSRVGRAYFVIQYASEDEKLEYTVNLTLSDGTDQLVCTAPLKGNSRQLVSFEIGFFSPGRRITELSLEFLADSNGGRISVSGPYYMEIDRTYADDFCLGDAALSFDATYTDGGIFIADSTQKTGFSGRFLRTSDKKVNHLRLFITTGNVGGIMEMRYSYFNGAGGILTTKSVNVALENGTEMNSYIVPLENADRIVSLSFLFDVAREGGIVVHSIEAVEVYTAQNRKNFGQISSCTYSSSEGIITVKGKIFHDFLIKHTDYTLYLYRLEASEKAYDAILAGDKPVASAKMSSEFEMKYKAGRQDKRSAVSMYALVASDGNEHIEILPAFHVKTQTQHNDDNGSFIKGLCVDFSSELMGMGAGASVVEVYLDKLVGDKKSGYIYSLGDTHVYFDSEYVHSIDKQVKKLCVAGCDVYLRLLIGADGDRLLYAEKSEDESLYLGINVKDEKARSDLFVAVDFLSGRYSDHENGNVKGYITGRSVNLPTVYGTAAKGLSDITDTLAAAMETIALSAAISMPEADIILPVSIDGGYDAELFLRSVCNRLDELGGLRFTVMIESSRILFSETADNESGLSPEVSGIAKILDRLSFESASAEAEYMYLWEPDVNETDERLIPSYIYTYMTLVSSGSCKTFLVSIQEKNHYDLLEIVRNIDTEKNKNGELTDFVLGMLGASEWDEVIPGFNESMIPVRIFETVSESGVISPLGEFVLFDFSSSFGALGWFAGDGCESVALASQSGNKVLCAQMNNKNRPSELLYHFDYPETVSMAPNMSFEFSIGDTGDEKYLLSITVRSGMDVLVAREIFTGGEQCTFTIDLSSLAHNSPVDSLSIGISALNEEQESFEFRLSEVKILSETLNDSDLARAIKQSRANAKDPVGSSPSDGVQSKPNYEFAFILVAVLVVCVVVAGFYDRNREQ